VDNNIHFLETIGLLESTAENGALNALAINMIGGMIHPDNITIKKKIIYCVNQKHILLSFGKYLRIFEEEEVVAAVATT
jgi:hypothetical protein